MTEPAVPLDALPRVAAPARRALDAAGVTSLRDLDGMSRADLTALHGMGPSAVRAIEAALAEHGLGLS